MGAVAGQGKSTQKIAPVGAPGKGTQKILHKIGTGDALKPATQKIAPPAQAAPAADLDWDLDPLGAGPQPAADPRRETLRGVDARNEQAMPRQPSGLPAALGGSMADEPFG